MAAAVATRLAPVVDERAYGMGPGAVSCATSEITSEITSENGMEPGAVSCATSAMLTLLFALKASSSPPRYLMMETISIVWISSSVGCIFAHFIGERLRRAAGQKVLSCEGCAQARETCQLGHGRWSGSGLCEWQAMVCAV